MLNAVNIHDQYKRTQTDDLRVLVIGAGIAGIVVAQLLRRQGRHPVLIERAEDERRPGYMLALMPMVDRALDDLGVRDHYRANSVPLDRYGLSTHTGHPLREDSLEKVLARYGDYRGIGRGELTETLSANGCDVAFSTTVTALRQNPTSTTATCATSSGTSELDFDLVIVADGLHSSTRALALGDRPVATVDTGWGGWVVWAPEDDDTDLGSELWGAGFFLGAYPVKGRLGVIIGGPNEDTTAGAEPFIASVRRRLTATNPRIESMLDSVAQAPDPYYWPLTDCRASTWSAGRTVLLGDAAAGFLPTAGIGAGMAIESAWVLASMLQGADPAVIDSLLPAYENAQRPRVEAAQNTSRQLASVMFRRSRTLATLRDLSMRIFSVEAALKPIQRLLADPPEPEAASIATRRNQ